MTRTVGVLGGMGPDATVDFMAKVIAATPAREDQDHVRMLVDHNPGVPNRQQALLHGGEDPGPVMAAMARGLEAAGADFLVIPCNTAHAFSDAIVAAVGIPLVSIIDLTVDACAGQAPVGLLATDGCIASRVFQEALDRRGITAVLPDRAEIDEIMRLVTRIKGGDRSEAVGASMRTIAGALVARGARAIIAGCTEIPLVLDATMIDVPLVSSTDVLAEATVAIARGERTIPAGR